jgi:transcription termination/antitermination protein NusG
MKQWHLTQCVARDKHAIEWLGRRGFETYYPMVRETRSVPRNRMSHKQRKLAQSGIQFSRTVLRPLIGRYVLTRFDVAADDWRTIFDIAGVDGVAMNGGLPAPVSDAIVDELRSREIEGAVPGLTPAKVIFAVGEQVRVTDGPFAGHTATVDQELTIQDMGETDILWACLKLFGAERRVPLRIDQVEHVS